jgi:hypothetical protein
MTPMTLDAVRALCDMATYRNAEQIAAGDQLLHLARSDTTLYAQVQGSKPYTVRIEFKDGAPSAKCTCPAARFSKFCKHAIAVLIVWAQSPERFAYGQQTLMETPPAAPQARGQTRRQSDRRAHRAANPSPRTDAPPRPRTRRTRRNGRVRRRSSSNCSTARRTCSRSRPPACNSASRPSCA